MDYYLLKLLYVIGWVLYGMSALWLQDDHMDELQGIRDPLWEIVEFISRGPSLDFLE